MHSVTVWACGCGVRYKAICETGFIPENKTVLACPQCETVVTILGTPENVFEEVGTGQWRSLPIDSTSIRRTREAFVAVPKRE